jgi:uncharacterized protein YbjT (DUF2867 family)
MAVLIIGGTRATGLLVAQRLVRQHAPVRILARNPAAAPVVGTADVRQGDITKPDTLPAAMQGVTHIVFTAGKRSGSPATRRQIRETEYEGVRNTLAAASAAGVRRFLYMTASGGARWSLASVALNLYKGNTLVWRRRAEEAIRASGLSYTIIRAGVLLNSPGGRRALTVTQRDLPLSIRYRVSRADVADGFVASLDDPRTNNTTFDVVWGKGPRLQTWAQMLASLAPDSEAREKVK